MLQLTFPDRKIPVVYCFHNDGGCRCVFERCGVWLMFWSRRRRTAACWEIKIWVQWSEGGRMRSPSPLDWKSKWEDALGLRLVIKVCSGAWSFIIRTRKLKGDIRMWSLGTAGWIITLWAFYGVKISVAKNNSHLHKQSRNNLEFVLNKFYMKFKQMSWRISKHGGFKRY